MYSAELYYFCQRSTVNGQLSTTNHGAQILHFPRTQTKTRQLLRLPGSLSSGSGAEDAGLFIDSRSERGDPALFNEGKLSQ